MEIYIINHAFVIYIDFTASQLQIQQLMASLSRSHTEYLIPTFNILVLILYSKFIKLMKNIAS